MFSLCNYVILGRAFGESSRASSFAWWWSSQIASRYWYTSLSSASINDSIVLKWMEKEVVFLASIMRLFEKHDNVFSHSVIYELTWRRMRYLNSMLLLLRETSFASIWQTVLGIFHVEIMKDQNFVNIFSTTSHLLMNIINNDLL